MSLAVIGAGFGRTGTLSMKSALEILGLGPCHHMLEVNSNPAQRSLWRAIAAGVEPHWDAVFEGYRAAVDWPAAYYWRELGAYYPHAKILLTVRSAESWYASMSKTIFPSLTASEDQESVGVKLIAERVFAGVLDDKSHAIEIYERNTTEVQAAFGQERLLVHNSADGWAPLCTFLGIPIPDTPYPSANSTADFNARVAKRA